MNRMQDRVVFIAGAAAGIGAASAVMLAREGARVVIGDVDEAGGAATLAKVQAAGGEAMFVRLDVTDEASVRAAVAAAVARFGRLDTLVNCAGGSLPADRPVHEVDLAVWDHTLNLDLKGTFMMCRHAIPEIVKAGGGTVVNMSSGAALRGSNPASAYSSAKGAIVSLTRSLAGAYAKHAVRVNCICAGRIATERVRKAYGLPGRPGSGPDPQNVDEQVKTYPFWVGEPEDIAAVVLFLASRESRMITGAAIPADGGRSSY